MMSTERFRRRPSAAMIVAVLALSIAMTGNAVAGPVASFARHFILGSSIKPHSITGNQIANHSITGQQIKLSKLGTVLHARLADVARTANSATTATSAANAALLGGAPPSAYFPASKVLRFSVSMNKGDAARTIGTLGPLTFTATCTADTTKTDATLSVSTSEGGTFVANDPTNLPPATMKLISPGDAPTPVLTVDTAVTPDGNDGSFAGFDAQNAVAVFSTAHTLAVAINTPGADCRFFGYLVNDA
jgi:hypothetical protein